MGRRHLYERAFLVGASAATIALTATSTAARDQPPPRTCTAAYDGGHERQRSGHLREARELYLGCAAASCGGLQRKCASAAMQLSSAIALIAPVVTDDAGNPLVDVQVKMDEQPLTARLDGHELPVDPGVHEFSFTARVGRWPGREVSTTRKIMIVEGQRGPVAITLPSPDEGSPKAMSAAPTTEASAVDTAPAVESHKAQDKPADDAPPPREAPAAPPQGGGPSPLPYVLGGVGLLGVGAGALLTYWGKTDNDALAQCSPNCQPSSVDHIRRLYLAADISFGAGAAGLGVAALLFATPHPHAAASATAKPIRRTAVFDVQPTRSGAFASFQGTF